MLKELDVICTVCVKKASAKISAGFFGELFGCGDFSFSKASRPFNPAGKNPFFNIELGGVDMLNIEILGSGQYLIRCGRADNCNRMAFCTMCLYKLACFGVDKARNPFSKRRSALAA